MNYSMVLYILGYILKFESAFLMLPALVSLLYQERAGIPFVITAAICLVLGIVFTHKKPSSSTVYTREGFVTVALSWIVMSIFGAIPFVWNGDIPYYVDALFETVSGFTTTGSSILSDVESLSHASLFWRSFSHWIGGMGVFVFIMSILPLMGGSTINLMKAESPGPSVSLPANIRLERDFVAHRCTRVVDNWLTYEAWREELTYPYSANIALLGCLLLDMVHEKLLTPDDIRNMGDIVTGKQPGRTSPEEIILFGQFGLPTYDVAWAWRCLQNAKALGLGQTLNLWETPAGI